MAGLDGEEVEVDERKATMGCQVQA
jgi:hypothetical protein